MNVPDENPSGLGAFEFPMRYPGQYFDKETNLAYNKARDYDSALGGYKQSDPIGLRGGLNTFMYVSARPLQAIDPLGLAECELRHKRGDIFTWDWSSPETVTDLGDIPVPDVSKVVKCLLKKMGIPGNLKDILVCIGKGLENSGIHLYQFEWEVHHETRQEVRTEEWCKEGCPPEWRFKKLVLLTYELLGETTESMTRYDTGRPPSEGPSPF